ncbi:MAG: sigma-70 family RNA polymerase sigma factor [Actinophytocola sp.]|nr:sigma-70 family RNA polymerase sigma factor [Actinophytocola sp.]
MTRHTDCEIAHAAQRFEQLADAPDPEAVDIGDLRAATASQTVQADEARLRETVETARSQGRSWNQIAVALGVSRQAARQRFADNVRT